MENERNSSLLNGNFANTMGIDMPIPAAISSFEDGEYFLDKIMRTFHLFFNKLVPRVKEWWNERRTKKHQRNKIEREEETKPIREEKHVLIPVEASVF
ncbi:MAG: hypothetical protein ACFFCS_14905 [Candidatus Hodarchaeota archaeon]